MRGERYCWCGHSWWREGILSRCSKTQDAAAAEARIWTTSVIRGAVGGKGTREGHKGQRSVFVALQVRGLTDCRREIVKQEIDGQDYYCFILWFLQFSRSSSEGIVSLQPPSWSGASLSFSISHSWTGEGSSVAADVGGTWSMGFPAAQPVRHDIPGTRRSSYPPPLFPQPMLCFLSCLTGPLMHQKDETSFYLRAWHLPVMPFPSHLFFKILCERTNSVILQPLR